MFTSVWCQPALHGDGTIDSVLNCWKLDEKPVASQLDNIARMIGDLWFDHVFTGILPGRHGAFGVLLHKARICRYIRSENGS